MRRVPKGTLEQNNIGALRLLFAAIVMLAHCRELSLEPGLAPLARFANPMLAVEGFFVLSGFLVVMSYEKARNWRDYAGKRLRRIYPGYAFVILAVAFLGSFFSRLDPAEYFGSDWLSYISNNLLFLNFRHPALPGLFLNSARPIANGALWTIKIEVMFYALVPFLAWLLHLRGRLAWIILIYLSSLAYGWYFTDLALRNGNAGYVEIAHQLPGQMCFFITGTALYYYYDWARRHYILLLLAGCLFCMVGVLTFFDPLYPAGVGMLVFAAAFGPYLGNFERYGDLSYGLYIWHFPIIQTLILLGLFAVHPVATVALTAVLALSAALLSWHLVEKRFLKKSSHYVTASASP